MPSWLTYSRFLGGDNRVHPEHIVLIIVPIIMACLNYSQNEINLQHFF
ncbi:hypothetical protein PPBDW_I22076 [Photobacterium kishitanii]|nr:hypothetical protein PPBDW_I22076 [Photobacterium kishitanii]